MCPHVRSAAGTPLAAHVSFACRYSVGYGVCHSKARVSLARTVEGASRERPVEIMTVNALQITLPGAAEALDFHPDFRLYLTTREENPRLSAFTVTNANVVECGLEEVLHRPAMDVTLSRVSRCCCCVAIARLGVAIAHSDSELGEARVAADVQPGGLTAAQAKATAARGAPRAPLSSACVCPQRCGMFSLRRRWFDGYA